MKPTYAPPRTPIRAAALTLALLLLPTAASAHEPPFTEDLHRERCTFVTFGDNPWYPVWPGYSLLLEGEEEDEGESVTITLRVTVTEDTETIDGVLTRVLEEREWEDDELVEVSRNFIAVCRETGDVWYFGEDVDDYEDGAVVGHEGAWRAGVNGARAGILMPGNPLNGARYYQEQAPAAEALDRAEVLSRNNILTVPAGTFLDVLHIVDTTPLEPGVADDKFYAYGWGLIKDAAAELVAVELPACVPDDQTLCLEDGRYEVRAVWQDFDGDFGPATAHHISADSGELWFFAPNNVELLVKVLDACTVADHRATWVFVAGLTNVGVTITVTDTETGQEKVYRNPRGEAFEPILDTSAFPCAP